METSFDSIQPLRDGRFWYDVPPAEAAKLFPEGIPKECAPINDCGQPCPWPWDPQQLVDAPLGQYHCPYCGGMQMAGMRHFDERDMKRD